MSSIVIPYFYRYTPSYMMTKQWLGFPVLCNISMLLIYFICSSWYLLIFYPLLVPPYLFIWSFDSRRDDSSGLNTFKPMVLNSPGQSPGSLGKTRCTGPSIKGKREYSWHLENPQRIPMPVNTIPFRIQLFCLKINLSL